MILGAVRVLMFLFVLASCLATGAERLGVDDGSRQGCNNNQRLFSVVKNREMGFIDRSGKIVIAAQYDRAEEFHDGLAKITVNSPTNGGPVYGYVNQCGESVIKPRFEESYDFSDGLALIEEGGLYGF